MIKLNCVLKNKYLKNIRSLALLLYCISTYIHTYIYMQYMYTDADGLSTSSSKLNLSAVSAETLYLWGLFDGNVASCPPPLKHGVASCSPLVESSIK